MVSEAFERYVVKLPFLSKADIEQVVEKHLKKFNPNALTNPTPIDVEGMAERYFNLSIDYKRLTTEGSVLGMAVFNDSDRFFYFEEDMSIRVKSIKAGTIVLDDYATKTETRLLFTLAHEIGHTLFHEDYILSLYNDKNYACRSQDSDKLKSEIIWTEERTMEWQAEYFASALLMPRKAVIALKEEFSKESCNPYLFVLSVEKTFKVSLKAALNRAKEIGLVPNLSYHDLLCYKNSQK